MPNKLRESTPGLLFFIFGAKNREKASWVVYFLSPFFLFMSFSFYEPWVNTAHVNDILTQRAMNNAFEFTFMPELDPSLHPFPPPPPSSFSLLHPPLSSLHYSSSPELNLISPLRAPPSFSSSPPTPLSHSREENGAGSDSSSLIGFESWICTVIDKQAIF